MDCDLLCTMDCDITSSNVDAIVAKLLYRYRKINDNGDTSAMDAENKCEINEAARGSCHVTSKVVR